VFFPQTIQENADDVFQIPPWPSPSTFFPINYTPTTLTYGTITLYSKLMTAFIHKHCINKHARKEIHDQKCAG
jgi:hypothetical protein